VVVFDGNDSNFASSFDPAGWNLNLDGINYTSGSAFISLIVSDGQNFGPDDDHTISINGAPLVSGGIFQGDSLCCGTGPTGNGNLWDIESFDITSFLTPGVNNLNIALGPGTIPGDAIADIVAAIDLPAGAAPPTPGVPEPSTWAMMLVGFAGLGFMGWRGARRTAAHAA
jgi:PEP-CTERM motif